jgi:serine/threonine protein kinase
MPPDNDLTRTVVPGSIPAAAPQPQPLGNIGAYRLVRKLGQGGMGSVFEAEQQHPKRLVALKIMAAGAYPEHSIQLFEREVQALARLKHAGIAAIYEAGQTEDGQRFFTMELVSGQTLNHYLEEHSLSQRDASSSPSAMPSLMRTSAASSIAISNPAISWCRSRTAHPPSRSSTLASPASPTKTRPM